MFRVQWSVVCLLLSAAPYIASDDGDRCETASPCSCIFPNGTGIDLSSTKEFVVKTGANESISDGNQNLTMRLYYYFPCKNQMIKPVDDTKDNTCNVPVAICRRQRELRITKNASLYSLADTSRYEKYGTNELATFTNDGRAIVYENLPSNPNVPNRTTVELECTPLSDQDSLMVDDHEPDAVIFRLYSRNACLKQIKEVSYRSTGSTLLIILFTLVLLYIVLGVCTKKFLMGAQGIEVIPNLSFWRDLPALCQDGWIFLRSGCRVPPRSNMGPASPDPNSYDSI